MDELIDQFVIEAREQLQQAAEDLLALEQTPGDRGRLESAFRAIHTLKGSVGLFAFGPMQDVLHRAEDLLTAARTGERKIDPMLIDNLLSVVEWVDRCVPAIEATGELTTGLKEQAVGILAVLRDGPAVDDSPSIHPNETPDWAVALLEDFGGKSSPRDHLIALRYEPHAECFFNGDDPLATVAHVPNILHVKITPKNQWPEANAYDPFRCNLIIELLAQASADEVQSVFRLIPDQVKLADMTPPMADAATDNLPGDVPQARESTTIRIDTSRLDTLVEIAGELVTAKNGLLSVAKEILTATGDERLSRLILGSHQDIERLVAQLYSGITRTRLIPVADTFRRFPRLVREIAVRLEKSVDLVIEGETVEVDREIVNALFEPLLHLIRNALDHGFESEAERRAAGKAGRGTLILRAQQSNEMVEIELVDDGRGIDPQKLRAAAVAKGLLTEGAAAELSDTAAQQLLFLSGFSTAQAVTDLSGRGVGLDVVRATVQKLGGRIDLKSQPTIGTTVSLTLPISFSMSRLMVIEAAGERYGIPMDDIVETVKLSPRDIKPVRAGQAFVLRDKTIPLLDLSELLQLGTSDPSELDLKVLIVRVVDDNVGIVVDAIAERAETLLRPLTGLLQGLPGISGTTLLGDGKVLVVLNIRELIT